MLRHGSPRRSDIHFFELDALAYWERLHAARLGYVSVSVSIALQYDLVKSILERYGLTMTRREVRQSMERMRSDMGHETSSEALTREIPTAQTARRLARPAPLGGALS